MNATVVHPTGIMGPEDFSVSETTKTVIEIINPRSFEETVCDEVAWLKKTGKI